MADPNDFQGVFISYREVSEANPHWGERMVEDYMSLKQNTILTAETVITIQNERPTSLNAQLFELEDRIGSGDFLTSDETGFTVDSTALSVDMTEA